mgnify:CR=1 FL=1
MSVPDVHLEPRLDDDARTVIAAADHVAELLPKPARTYPIGESIDPVTWAAMKEMARHVA